MSKPNYKVYYALHGCRPEPYMVIPGENPDSDIYRAKIGNKFDTLEDAENAQKWLEQRQKELPKAIDAAGLVIDEIQDKLMDGEPQAYEDDLYKWLKALEEVWVFLKEECC